MWLVKGREESSDIWGFDLSNRQITVSFIGAENTGHNSEVMLRDQVGHVVLATRVGYLRPKGSCLFSSRAERRDFCTYFCSILSVLFSDEFSVPRTVPGTR